MMARSSICIHLVVTLTLGLSVWLSVDITSMLLCAFCFYLFYALSLPRCFPQWYASFDPEHYGSVNPENHRQMSPLLFFSTVTAKEDNTAPRPHLPVLKKQDHLQQLTKTTASLAPPSPKC